MLVDAADIFSLAVVLRQALTGVNEAGGQNGKESLITFLTREQNSLLKDPEVPLL